MAQFRLYDYQLEAINNMKNGCILCGGVGSGKSLTALGYYYKINGGNLYGSNYGRMQKDAHKLIIITTAHKRDSHEWEKDMGMFNLEATVDSWNNITKYEAVENAFFIFDEQRVVGNGTWVKSFLKIAKKNQWILLSATPGDTWADYIPVFIANGFYKNRSEFNREHAIWKCCGSFYKVDRYINIGRLIRLRDSILVDMDFNRQTVHHEIDINVGYDKIFYKTVMKTRMNPWINEPCQNAAELCGCLRKCVNSDPSRAEAILELCRKHPKVIIFYNFDYELDILKDIKYEIDTKIAEWNGHKHQEIPNTDRWVYLVQYTAGCEGWNCIKTDTIIFYSQNYSYKVMLQASGRIDRLNTPFTDLYYYHIKSDSTIDKAIAKALSDKKKFNEGKFVVW